MKDKKLRIKYHDPPLRFDYALFKYVPDIEKIKKFRKKIYSASSK